MYLSTKQAKVKLPLFTCWWRLSAFIVRVLLILSFFTDFKDRYEFKLCMQELVRPAGFIPSISYINFMPTSWHTQAPPWKNKAVDSYCSAQEWWQWEKATVVEKHQLGKCLTSGSSPKQMQTNKKHEKALNKLPKSHFLELLTIKWLCKLIKPSVLVQGVHSPIVLAIAHSDNRELVRWGKAAVKALWS